MPEPIHADLARFIRKVDFENTMASWTLADREAVEQAIAELTRHDRSGTSALARAVKPAEQALPDGTRLLPVVPELHDALPHRGLVRGSTVATIGSTSLILTLLAAGMSQGGWAAVVGVPWLGALSAHEDYRIPLDRLALIPDPGPDWPAVVGALIDGLDLVVVRTPDAADGVVRSLQARAREKGCVLIPTSRWPNADVVLERTSIRWTGLRKGRGRLRRQHATFQVTGRGRAAKAKTLELMFPPESIAGPEPQPIPVPQAEPAPLRGTVPENRQPVRGEENALWANIVPNEPPPGW
jgi:hypothetical protein